MRSKLIWIVGAIALGAFLVNNHLEQKAKREAQNAEISRVYRETKTRIMESSARYNAVTDWEKQLNKGEPYRLAPILTVELESLWQGERPVLFIGSVKDIWSGSADSYEVLIEQSLHNMEYIFSAELRMSVTAPKALIDSFLQKYPKLLTADGFDNGVAAIAKIHRISTSDERDADGERVEIKTGHGQLLDLIYTGDVFFLND
jgi:hypothetical protein